MTSNRGKFREEKLGLLRHGTLDHSVEEQSRGGRATFRRKALAGFHCKDRICIELVTSDRKRKVFREGSNEGTTGPNRLDDTRCTTYTEAGWS